MRLSYIFEQLTYGELSQLSLGGSDNIGIQASDYVSIMPYINLALTELYKRFDLKTSEVIIQQYDEIQLYTLHSDYAETNIASQKPYKYIMDSVYQPFLDDVLKIENVSNEDGEELYLNDSTAVWTINTPAFNVIQIPYPEKENILLVTYKANHKIISVDDITDPADMEIEIPHTLLEALLYYIAHRKYANLHTENDPEVNNLLAKFEASCARVNSLGLLNDDNTVNTKLDNNSWE